VRYNAAFSVSAAVLARVTVVPKLWIACSNSTLAEVHSAAPAAFANSTPPQPARAHHITKAFHALSTRKTGELPMDLQQLALHQFHFLRRTGMPELPEK
jgi:hypothetical protein